MNKYFNVLKGGKTMKTKNHETTIIELKMFVDTLSKSQYHFFFKYVNEILDTIKRLKVENDD